MADAQSSCNAASSTDSPARKIQKSEVPKSTFVKKEEIASGKWLRLTNVTYRDPTGRERLWETVERTTKPPGSKADAVVMITTLRRLLHYDCLICVKQYRPPVNAYTLEFPAGLIDKGETIEEAALRELREETGYIATIKHCSPATTLDAGLQAATAVLVTAEIDGNDAKNINVKAQPDDGEFIEVLHIPVDDFLQRCNQYASEGVVVDARVYSYAIALAQCTKTRQPKPDGNPKDVVLSNENIEERKL